MHADWIKFLEEVTTYCDNLEKSGCDVLFFRGHTKKQYELLPTLLRGKGRDIVYLETALFYDFVSMAGTNIKSNDSWEILFTMRHYGIPTRLLDWTTNFANALYFALSDKELDGPHIWILNPFLLSEKNPGFSVGLLNPYYDIDDDYVSLFVNILEHPKAKRPQFPLALYPPRNNPRIFAQQGVFTLHGMLNDKLDALAPDTLKRFDIPVTCIEDAKKFLTLSGIHEYSIYPDLFGLANHLTSKYKL
jgi:hypothetical protein